MEIVVYRVPIRANDRVRGVVSFSKSGSENMVFTNILYYCIFENILGFLLSGILCKCLIFDMFTMVYISLASEKLRLLFLIFVEKKTIISQNI